MHRTFEIDIEKLVYGGSGLGRCRGKVVFVPFAAPGDRLLVEPVREKKDYVQARICRVLAPGQGRTDPPCPHFGSCGGCHWQHLQYPLQVAAKGDILREILRHRFPLTRDLPVTVAACPEPFAYRSRARLQLGRSGSGAFPGFFRQGSRDVEAIDSCLLLRPPLDRALAALCRDTGSLQPAAYAGGIDIAGSDREGVWALGPAGEGEQETLLEKRAGGFRFKVTASTFFQANDFMVGPLLELVRDMAADSGRGKALDLFAGVGLFSLPLAGLFGSVIAVERSPTASRLCSGNAASAGIDRIRTVCADAAAWLESGSRPEAAGADLVVLDPPRTGAGARVIHGIRSLGPGTILYVSCDPQTLTRDLSLIPATEYAIDRVEGLDMFPQTFHFETVVRLRRLRGA